MKKPLIVLPFGSLLFFMLFSYGFNRPAGKTFPDNAAKGFAVVELFTSEGCSSCPPAEEAVAALAKEYPSNVFVLCLHVDYWDNLGWKDAFSSADYTRRQQQYAAIFNINSIYTPQAIVNGRIEFTGSDKKKLYATVQDALAKNINSTIEISANASGPKEITVSYKADVNKGSMLQLAIVQPAASSAVQRGENKGRLLHHINVVRSLKTVNGGKGVVHIALPEGLVAKDCRVIAFIQSRADLRIIGAAEYAIQ